MDEGRAPWLWLTGASSPLGRAVAVGWRRQGGRVLAVSRERQDAWADATAVVDLRRPEAEAALATWGATAPPTALVYAAGLVYAGPALAVTADERRQMGAVNWEAAWVAACCARRAAPPGAAQAVVFVSSVDAARVPEAGPDAVYGAAKAGLEALARHLAVEWGPAGVRVNAVRLGPLTAGMPATAAVRRRLRRAAADHRLTTPAEAADVILWLLGPDAAPVTGAVIPVDHGFGLRY